MRARVAVLLVFVLPWQAVGQADAPALLRIVEIVADAQHDWNRDNRTTPSDEFVELLNDGSQSVDLTEWSLLLNDTTPNVMALDGRLEGGGRFVVQNPPGELNNNGHVALLDPQGFAVDEVRYGSWATTGEVPSADATGPLDEALRWINGSWSKGPATPGRSNDEPGWWTETSGPLAGGEAWHPGNRTGTARAYACDVMARLLALRLWRSESNDTWMVNATSVVAPTTTLTLETNLSTGNRSFSYEWELVTSASSYRWGTTLVRVDADPPPLPELPASVWVNATAESWTPPAAVDAGVGGVQWQWAIPPENLTTWSSSSELDLSALLENGSLSARARVRDAFQNTADWSESVMFRADNETPGPVTGLRVDGQGPFQVSWEPSTDVGSGVALYEVRRRHAGFEHAWIRDPENRTLVDAPELGGGNLSYGVRAFDHAGNAGPWRWAEAEYAGKRPSVAGIRVIRPLWSRGIQEVRFDFDRPMNASHAPRLEIPPGAPPPDAARYLTNGSSYLVAWSTNENWLEGHATLGLSGALSRDGTLLQGPAQATFWIDRTAPQMTIVPASGWTNSTQLRGESRDNLPLPVRISWKAWRADEREPTAYNTSEASFAVDLTEGNWSLRAYAVDAAGHRTQETRLTVRVDRTPPLVATPALAGTAERPFFAAPIRDAASGVDWGSLVWTERPHGWEVRPDPGRGRVLLIPPPDAKPNATFRGRIRDAAGNQAELGWVLSPATVGPAAPKVGDGRQEESDGSSVPADPWPNTSRPEKNVTPWILAVVGAGGLALSVARRARRSRRRARRRSASFAERIRRARGTLRSEDSPAPPKSAAPVPVA